MPQIFQTDDGEIIRLDLSFDELQTANTVGTRYVIQGADCTRLIEQEMREAGEWKEKPKKQSGHTLLWNRPFRSDGLGVGVEQIDEAEKLLRQNGVLGEFDRETGELIATSDKQFQEAGKALGLKTGRDGWEATGQTGRGPEREKERLRRMIERGELDGI